MTGQRKTVLVVDDEQSIRVVVRDLLEVIGYEVIECCDANEALAALDRRAGSISMLIADYAVPGMTGLALAREVARTAPWIRTLIISGHQRVKADCKRVAADFLAKPFGTAELMRAVRRLDGPPAMAPKAVRLAGRALEMAV